MKIIVEDEETKQRILEQSEFIHNFLMEVDTKHWGILGHIYVVPEIIIIKDNNEKN